MIPAIKYISIIRQYAFANGLPFFTLREVRRAIANYETFCSSKN